MPVMHMAPNFEACSLRQCSMCHFGFAPWPLWLFYLGGSISCYVSDINVTEKNVRQSIS